MVRERQAKPQEYGSAAGASIGNEQRLGRFTAAGLFYFRLTGAATTIYDLSCCLLRATPQRYCGGDAQSPRCRATNPPLPEPYLHAG
jgi:hypothetical protein